MRRLTEDELARYEGAWLAWGGKGMPPSKDAFIGGVIAQGIEAWVLEETGEVVFKGVRLKGDPRLS